jgi:hypothetical protein
MKKANNFIYLLLFLTLAVLRIGYAAASFFETFHVKQRISANTRAQVVELYLWSGSILTVVASPKVSLRDETN